MKLIDLNIKLCEIMIDPLNPRNINGDYDSQKNISDKIMRKSETVELLISMQRSIKWVNKIVIREVSSLPKEVRDKICNLGEYKYIIVEGNTRLACLKSGDIDGYKKDTCIPVLIAQKEDCETKEQFELEIMITQAIANIMVVKHWGEIPKAKRIYEIYVAKKELEPNKKQRELIKDISDSSGVEEKNVKKMITRYSIYEELNVQRCSLDEKYWGFLEAFERSNDSKEFIGMNSKTMEFEWNCDENADCYDKLEVFRSIPRIINKAFEEDPSSKNFRDAFGNMLKNDKDFYVRKETIDDFLDGNCYWKDFLKKGTLENSTKESWKVKLKEIYKDVDIFPIGSDWAIEFKHDLQKISDKINKHLNNLNEQIED